MRDDEYKTLFRILDAIFAVLDFIRMVPSYIWFGISCAYILTIYRAFLYVQAKRQPFKSF